LPLERDLLDGVLHARVEVVHLLDGGGDDAALPVVLTTQSSALGVLQGDAAEDGATARESDVCCERAVQETR
jgi:hypothetical protein